MAQYFSVYFAADDTELTPIGDQTNAAEFNLRFDLAEEDEDEIELYAEADSGYVVESATISLVVVNSTDRTDRFAIAGSDQSYNAFGADYSLGNFGSGADSSTFYVKARTTSSDTVVERDAETGLEITGIVSPE